LGKAVVATRSPSVADYVEDGKEGFLVEAGDVPGYREAILRLTNDETYRLACEAHARTRSATLTYAELGRTLERVCTELVE
ncbi:MAG: hypothetical protein QOE29_1246, partial [Gaiellaceae bacterium]|nr:hypothetical protein [Gaiellaceae bacterium]